MKAIYRSPPSPSRPLSPFLLVLLLVVSAPTTISAQHGGGGAADGLHSMLNQLVQNSGSDVQSLSYCRISTRDLISTAQSTASRVLQGVCNPSELNDRFEALERTVSEQFNVLKTMVVTMEEQLRQQNNNIKKNHAKLRKTLRALRRGVGGVGPLEPPSPDYLPPPGDDDQEEGEEEEEEEEEEYIYDTQSEESPRLTEIQRYNSTMHQQEDGRRVFTYYWRVGDVTYKMDNWGGRRSLRSSSFYTFQGGYRMYMRIFPNQRGESFYIHVGLTKGDYDHTLDWPFRLKHRVQVLDHDPLNPQDLTSRLWDPTQLCSAWHWRRPDSDDDNYECVGLGFDKNTLRTRFFINQDTVVIKLTVYLTS